MDYLCFQIIISGDLPDKKYEYAKKLEMFKEFKNLPIQLTAEWAHGEYRRFN